MCVGEQVAVLGALHEAQSEVDLRALVHAYSPLLFRVARSVLRNSAEAEDAVQETFLRVVERRAALPEVRDMRLWLLRITWNIVLDRKRRITPEQMLDGFAEGLFGRDPSVEQMIASAEQMRAVLDAVDRLPVAERRALMLAAVEELSPAEIARMLGRSEAAVRGLIFRARGRLRARLAPVLAPDGSTGAGKIWKGRR